MKVDEVIEIEEKGMLLGVTTDKNAWGSPIISKIKNDEKETQKIK